MRGRRQFYWFTGEIVQGFLSIERRKKLISAQTDISSFKVSVWTRKMCSSQSLIEQGVLIHFRAAQVLKLRHNFDHKQL